ncbi:hypothetical protein H0H81_000245 [Sphagnurus paluster]|uniref:F-box domain-containing protein n=1 Tax=Sphagnurus paluster TaxID=117069 RepID=A0A9P7GNM0_9AGAR|nr:hypothetical protein H0H81_000245 [Sphagnurus paluster]
MPDHDNREPSAFSSLTAREAGYARIQKEIAALNELARSWRQRHNELSLIHRLPPEILSTIFSYITLIHLPRTSLQWIQCISHICSHWRRIALTCPSLWADIPFHNPRWAREMLRRSKKAPLTIAYTGEPQYSRLIHHLGPCLPESATSVLKDALAELWRVKSLRLLPDSLMDEELAEEVIGLLDSPAPFLESCHLWDPGFIHWQRSIQHLFAGDCPRLRQLTIENLSLNWEGHIFTNLRSFRFSQSSIANQGSIAKLVGALSFMHHLESLQLSNLLDSSLFIPPVNPANLPVLQELSLESDVSTCLYISNHIIYPSTARVSIVCSILESEKNTMAGLEFIQKLTAHLGAMLPRPIRALTVRQGEIMLHTPPADEPIDQYSPPQVKIRVAGTHDLTYKSIARCLLLPTPLRHLEQLRINCHLERDTCVAIFGGLDRLKHIINSAYSFDFLQALSPEITPHPTRSGKRSSVRFRALRRLGINGWDFQDYGTHPTKACVRRLEQCLRERSKARMNLEQLDISDCVHVHKYEVDSLSFIVDNVEWDEQGNFTEESDSELYASEYDGFFGHDRWY